MQILNFVPCQKFAQGYSLTFVNQPAATGFECQNRDTSDLMPPGHEALGGLRSIDIAIFTQIPSKMCIHRGRRVSYHAYQSSAQQDFHINA